MASPILGRRLTSMIVFQCVVLCHYFILMTTISTMASSIIATTTTTSTTRVSIHAFQMQYSSRNRFYKNNKYSLQRTRRSNSSSSSGSSSCSQSWMQFSPLFLGIQNDTNENHNSNKKTPPPPNNNNNNKATLTKDTTWRLRFSLNGVPTRKGRKVGELLNVDVQFLQEDGYEPPQGQLKQVTSNQQSNVTYLKIRSGRWQLSEDPEDRKDGLWIWGLFEEPLYPFLLLQIETEEYVIPGSDSSGSGKDADVIEPLTLYAQVNHRRDKKTGQVELDSAPLNLREFESVKADPFGAAKVDIYQEIKCGQLSFRPLFLSESSSTSSLSSSSSSSSSNDNKNANRNATL